MCPRCGHDDLEPHCERVCDWWRCGACRLTYDPERGLAMDKAGPVGL